MGYFDDQEAAIARKQKLAATLMQGNPGNSQLINTGRFMVPNLGVIGDALANRRGTKMLDEADADTKALVQARNERLATLLQKGMSQAQSDPMGAIQTLAQDESTAPYAKALLTAQLRPAPDHFYQDAMLKQRQEEFEWKKNHPQDGNQGAFYGNTVNFQDKDGNVHTYQLGKNGQMVELSVPGMTVAKETPWDKRDKDTQAKIESAGGITEAKATSAEQAASQIGLASGSEIANEIYKDADTLINHPGLDGIVGFQGMLPNAPWGQAAAAEALRKQLTGKAFIQVRQVLKGAGQITDYEGQRAEDSAIRAQKAQSKEDFIAAMKDYKTHVARGFEIMRRHAEGDFSPLPQDWKAPFDSGETYATTQTQAPESDEYLYLWGGSDTTHEYDPQTGTLRKLK